MGNVFPLVLVYFNQCELGFKVFGFMYLGGQKWSAYMFYYLDP